MAGLPEGTRVLDADGHQVGVLGPVTSVSDDGHDVVQAFAANGPDDDDLDDWSIRPDPHRIPWPTDFEYQGRTTQTEFGTTHSHPVYDHPSLLEALLAFDDFRRSMAKTVAAMADLLPRLSEIFWEIDAPKRRAQHVEYHRRRRSRARRGRR